MKKGKSKDSMAGADRWVHLPPDPTLPEVLTKSEYPLPHAISELVDNSFDHKSKTIVIRFGRTATQLVFVQVLDDGTGIEPAIFDNVMRFGYKSPHKARDIGMYGVGLKTASLSQANRLWVFSRVKSGQPAGRELIKSELSKQRLGILKEEAVASHYMSSMKMENSAIRSSYGTIVEWREVEDFTRSEENIESYLKAATLDLDAHLGLIFHRFIESNHAKIFIEVQESERIISKTEVRPINPFRYPKSGSPGWPKTLNLTINQGAQSKPLFIKAKAHIWPPRTKLAEYKIRRVGGRANTIDSQGLYFYLNDRLVIAGGWSNIRTPEAHFSLARIELELTPELQRIIGIVYTKDKAKVPQSFISAMRAATASDGTSYANWLDIAQTVFRTRDPNQVAKLPTLPVPGSGLPPQLQNIIRKSEFPKSEAIRAKWSRLSTGIVFKVDRSRKRLILNEIYRRALNRIVTTENGISLTLMLLYYSLADNFKGRSTTRLEKIETLINQSLHSVLK